MIAPWSKDRIEAVRSQSQAINARSESVHEKPTFRSAFKSRRCLIPASGYYEWATELGKYESKQPFFIQSDVIDKTLAFAGIFDRWIDPSGETFESASIITRPAVDFLATIHNRMPTFLPTDRWDTWLDPKLNEVEEIRKLKLEIAALTQAKGEKFYVCFKGHVMKLKFTPTARINGKGKQDKGERISCNICFK
jgi:putative SOS response-associated peptidase YedK